ncbi:hypothetical protein M569_10687, partial [Genlisea aurea]
DLVRNSCVHASYPDLCLRTLSAYAGAANNPRELAQAAVKFSLGRVRDACAFLSQLKGDGRREQGALNDCVSQIGDSIDELSESLTALQQLRRGAAEFRWQMSNAETWVSAALTNEDTCLDGFREINGKIRSDVRQKVSDVARVTSNALYLINLAD